MKIAATTLLLGLAAGTAAGGAVELTLDNFDAETGGKNVFVKFQAPCKSVLTITFYGALMY